MFRTRAPSYQRIAHLSFDERLAIMRTPEFRARVLAEAPSDETSPIAARLRSFEHMFPLGDPPQNPEIARELSLSPFNPKGLS